MATQNNKKATKKLLTPKGIAVCKQIAGTNNDYSQRATALLAINSGSTHGQAAAESGLTIWQVKYWLTRFRKLGIKSFPTEMLAAKVVEAAAESNAEVKKTKPAKAKKKDKKDKKKSKAKDKKNKQETKKDKSKKKIRKTKRKNNPSHLKRPR